jgi:hypothetical protein
MKSVFTRRFVLVTALLLTLNTALWLTPEGLAVRRMALPQLFGSHLVRGEVVESNGQDWRIDRGVIASASLTQLTLKEADGRVQTISLSLDTKVTGLGRTFPLTALAKGWRVLVTWPANGAADVIKVEKRSGKGRGR